MFVKLMIIYDINNMLPKTEYICVYMFISILPTHLCQKKKIKKKYVNFTNEMERFTVLDYRKMKANSVYPGEVGGLVYCTWDCIAY